MKRRRNKLRARNSSSNKSPVHTLLAPLIGCILFGCDPDITPPGATTLPSFSIPDPNDITFVIVADPQFSAERTPANAEYHKEVSRNVARAINRIKTETWIWPTDGTSTVDAPLAVVMAGDLTQFAQFMEAETYRDVWDADKPGSTIDYPVYPGSGNHDYNRDRTAIVLYVKNRMRFHSHVTNMHDPESTHRSIYSWDWGNVHFVQLNQFVGAGHADMSGLMAGDPPTFEEALYSNGTKTGSLGTTFPDILAKTDPSELDWLRQDLATHVGDSGKSVVLIQHFPWFDSGIPVDLRDEVENILCRRASSDEPCDDGYNLAVIFSGHYHRFDLRYLPELDVVNIFVPTQDPATMMSLNLDSYW